MFLINHFELFGLQQVYLNLRRTKPTSIPFEPPLLYRLVRHPLHLGTATVLWATPHMSLGHLLFSAVMTVYIVIGIYFEERDLERRFGDSYQIYKRTTPMLFPLPRQRRAPAEAEPASSMGD